MTKDEKIKEVMELVKKSNDLMFDAGSLYGESNTAAKLSEVVAHQVINDIESKLRELIQ